MFQGFTFEMVIQEMCELFFPGRTLNEKEFSLIFKMKDMIVDLCVLNDESILIIQMKYRFGSRISGITKIQKRLSDMKKNLREIFPHFTIKHLILGVERNSSHREKENGGILIAKRIWTAMIRLKNYLLNNGFLSQKIFEERSDTYKKLLLETQIRERKMDEMISFKFDEFKKIDFENMIKIQSLKKRAIDNRRKIKDLSLRIKEILRE